VGDGTGGGNGTGNGAANGNGVGDGVGNGNGAANGNGNGSGDASTPVYNTDPDVTIQVSASGPVPDDLDYSGATFLLTSVHVPDVETTCTTDSAGTCTVEHAVPGLGSGLGVAGQVDSSTVRLPAGAYAIEQTSTSAGLQIVDADLGTVSLCGFLQMCVQAGTVEVQNASVFRTEVITTVLDSETGDPVADAGYTLSGPDYPHVGGPGPGPIDLGTLVSDIDGRFAYTGSFLPGAWTLTPADPPSGYLEDQAREVEIPASAADAAAHIPVDVEVLLHGVPATSDETETETGTGAGDTGTDAGDTQSDEDPAVDPDPAGTPQVGPDPGQVTGTSTDTGTATNTGTDTGTATGTGTGTGAATGAVESADAGAVPAAGRNGAAGRVAPAPAATAAAATGQPARAPGAPSTGSGATASGSAAEVAADGAPVTEVRTRSSSITELGFVGFGILFVAAVVVGTRIVVQRARRRG
jgi:hypothetical protein